MENPSHQPGETADAADPFLADLRKEAESFPVPESEHRSEPAIDGPALLLEISTGLGQLSFLTATTVFGTPMDVTLEEIATETLYPANAFTESAVRNAATVPAK